MVETTETWSAGNVQVAVHPVEPLEGDSAYTLHVELCGQTSDVTFSTAPYGSPVDESAGALVGNTYAFDFSQAEILEPEELGSFVSAYLTEPLLVGVASADASLIGLVAAQGQGDGGGSYEQAGGEVWIFADADFTTNPYFAAEAESIEIAAGDVSIPIEAFALDGTFAPDGTSIGGGHAEGWADTREMGALLGIGDEPSAFCDFAVIMDVTCSACADGEPYCMSIEIAFDEAALVEGVTIEG